MLSLCGGDQVESYWQRIKARLWEGYSMSRHKDVMKDALLF